jgi:hypothetical protein
MKQNKFLEQWNTPDEVCPHCKRIVPSNKLTKANVKRMFSFNAGLMMFWIAIFVLILLYFNDTSHCRAWMKQLQEDPKLFCDLLLANATSQPDINIFKRAENETTGNTINTSFSLP